MDRLAGDGQTVHETGDGQTVDKRHSFLKIDTFLLPKKDSFLLRKIHQKTEGKSIWGSS
jgi:hypothetical protein